MARISAIARLALAVLLSASIACGYSVLTHEAIIDSLWDTSIQKLLLKRFPATTPEELKQAHAYAYGGCIIQDLGYYPFSSSLFSDLVHYVRSGDFVVAMIRESQDLNEYAFALGALSHYAADTNGHRIATNRAVAMLYPPLRLKFGDTVTYWDDPLSHARTEFGFDVLQIAQGRYAPDQYRGFIGFKVAKPVFERAVLDTYGLEMKDLFKNLNLSLGTYRYTVRSILPGMTRVAWQLKKTEITKEIPGITRKKFLYNLSRASYEKEWGSEYKKPGIRTRIVTSLFRIIPKSGPFKSLPFKMPTPEVERIFMASFNATVDRYRVLLAEVGAGPVILPNENIDTGELTHAGKYKGADEAYAKLVGKLAHRQFVGMSPELRSNILAFYKDVHAPTATEKQSAEWANLGDELGRLQAVPVKQP